MIKRITLAAMICSSTIASAEQIFPKDFDPNNTYPTTSYAELFSYVKLTRGTTDEYSGKRFKLFVRIPLIPYGNINPIWSSMPLPSWGAFARPIFLPKVDAPNCKVCAYTWPIMNSENATQSDMFDAVWQNFKIYLAVNDVKALDLFRRSLIKCIVNESGKMEHFGCFGVLAGTMNSEVVDFKSSLGLFGPSSGKTTIPFMKIEKMELYRDEDEHKRSLKESAELAKIGGKLMVQIFKYGQ